MKTFIGILIILFISLLGSLGIMIIDVSNSSSSSIELTRFKYRTRTLLVTDSSAVYSQSIGSNLLYTLRSKSDSLIKSSGLDYLISSKSNIDTIMFLGHGYSNSSCSIYFNKIDKNKKIILYSCSNNQIDSTVYNQIVEGNKEKKQINPLLVTHMLILNLSRPNLYFFYGIITVLLLVLLDDENKRRLIWVGILSVLTILIFNGFEIGQFFYYIPN